MGVINGVFEEVKEFSDSFNRGTGSTIGNGWDIRTRSSDEISGASAGSIDFDIVDDKLLMANHVGLDANEMYIPFDPISNFSMIEAEYTVEFKSGTAAASCYFQMFAPDIQSADVGLMCILRPGNNSVLFSYRPAGAFPQLTVQDSFTYELDTIYRAKFQCINNGIVGGNYQLIFKGKVWEKDTDEPGWIVGGSYDNYLIYTNWNYLVFKDSGAVAQHKINLDDFKFRVHYGKSGNFQIQS